MRKFNTYNNMRFARDECYTTAAVGNVIKDNHYSLFTYLDKKGE